MYIIGNEMVGCKREFGRDTFCIAAILNTGLFEMIVGVLTTSQLGTDPIIVLMFVESQRFTCRVPIRYVTKTWSVVLLNKKKHTLLSEVYCI